MRERKGRMINKDISNSNKFAALSPEAAVLFTMLIPHYNSHGKMNGGPGYIKDEICPKVPYLNSKTIPGLLLEISETTNVKWFKCDGRYWIHSINFLSQHQDLDHKKLGRDLIPDYSETYQILVHPEVEVEVEVEVKKESPAREKPAPDPRVSEIINYFSDICQIRRGFKPTINGPQDGAIVKKALRELSIEQVKECIEFFLVNEKADAVGVSLSIALSAHTQNQFKAKNVKGDPGTRRSRSYCLGPDGERIPINDPGFPGGKP